MRHTLLVTMAAVTGAIASTDSTPRALVYRGPAACPGCPEAIAELLESSPWKFHVTYAGPDEDVDVDENSLKGVQVYAQAGGPGKISLRLIKPMSTLQAIIQANFRWHG